MTKSNEQAIWIATLAAAPVFGLQVGSARLKAPTYDEQGYIARGYAFVKLGDLHIRIGTPIGLNALNALPLLALPDVRLPVDSPSWSGTDFHPIAEQFMWHVNPNADQILFLARLPTMYLTLLLCAFVYRWAKELWPEPTATWGGLLALAPVRARSQRDRPRAAGDDRPGLGRADVYRHLLGLALSPRAARGGNLAVTGVSVGLAQATKFSALLHLPILALVFVLRAFSSMPFALSLPWYSGLGSAPGIEHRTGPQPWWDKLGWLLLSGALIGVVALLTLWAVYGFQLAPHRWALTAWPVPAPAHFDQLLDLSGRLAGEEERLPTSFLLGELYPGGRWEYFPVAFLVKTPIPTLVFLAAAGADRLAGVLPATTAQSGLPNPRRRRGSAIRVGARSPQSEANDCRLREVIGPSAGRCGCRRWSFLPSACAATSTWATATCCPLLPYLFVLAGRMGPWIAEQLGYADRPAARAAGRGHGGAGRLDGLERAGHLSPLPGLL